MGTQSHTSSPAFVLSDLDFADDIALLSHNHDGAQTLLTAVEQEAPSVGLQINRLKMECMLVATSRLTVTEGPITRVKYQGSWVMSHHTGILRFGKLRFGRHASTCTGHGNSMCPTILKYVRYFQASVETILL